MKRSEAIQIIGKVLTFGKGGFPLDKKQKYEQMSLADIILTELEEAGMLPPDTNLKDCPDPDVQLYVNNIDIPHWLVLGWDNEAQ
jgi:hypothetical protein